MSYDQEPAVISVLNGCSSELPPAERRPVGMSRQEFRRKQREAASKTSTGLLTRTGLPKQEVPTIVLVNCPKCKKHRLTKYLGEDGKPIPTSTETVDIRGESRLVDICGFCVDHYREQDKRYVLRNLKKLQEAMRNRQVDRNTTDQDFSIDL